MLILPIGQEKDTVRRTPWVSYALIGFNILVLILISTGGDTAARAWRTNAIAAIHFLFEHPYLDVPDSIAPYLDHDALEDERQQMSPERRPDAVQQADEQRELDRLSALAESARHALPGVRWGFIPRERRALSAVTSLFVHAGWMHLIGNMLFLFLTGPFVEDLYGRALFSALYLGSGFAATAAFTLRHSDSTVPLVGASGAIAGIMGAFLVRLGAQRIRLLIVPIPPLWMFRFRVLVPAYVVLPLWLLEQIWYAYRSDQAGIAWWAHIGGFVFGVLVALVVGLTRIEERFIDPHIEAEISLQQHPALERAVDARVAGDLIIAQAEITTVLTAEPQNVDAWNEQYEIAIAAGDATRAGNAALRLLEILLRRNERDLAMRHIADARDRLAGYLPVRFLMTAAGFLEKEGDGEGALLLYLEVTQRAPQDPASFRAWYRRGEILRMGGDGRGARAAYENARAHPACVDGWPQAVERALSLLG